MALNLIHKVQRIYIRDTYPHDLVQSYVGDIRVARQIDGEPVRDVEHVAAPRVLSLTCFRIQSADGHVRDRCAVH